MSPATIKKLLRPSCKVREIFIRFLPNLVFLDRPSQTSQYKISRKYVQWEPSRYMGTDGRTDMTKLIEVFREFAAAPKKR